MLKDKIILPVMFSLYLVDGGLPLPLEITTGDLVTTRGKERAASILADNDWVTDIALGTNNDPESTEDLALGAEFYEEALNSVAANGQTVLCAYEIEALDIGEATYTVRELGLKDAANNLICRQVLDTAIEFSGTQKLAGVWGIIVS